MSDDDDDDADADVMDEATATELKNFIAEPGEEVRESRLIDEIFMSHICILGR